MATIGFTITNLLSCLDKARSTRSFSHAAYTSLTVRRITVGLLGAMLIFGFAVNSYAQSASASISGTVTDQNGYLVKGAIVKLTDEQTNVKQASATGSTGNYTIIDIPPGIYSIEVNTNGFSTIQQSHIVLQVNQALSLSFKLTVGSPHQTVTVSDNVSTVQSTTADLGTVITRKSVNDLPLNGRNFTELLTLTPGVSRVDVAQNPGTQNGTSYTFPAVNGQRNRSNMFLLDGMNDLAFYGNYNYQPVIDDIEEFKVQSHNDLAEFGQVTGGIVNVVTKNGTNNFHGSAWEFFRNQNLDASNYFNPTRNPLRQNVFGVSVGGPVDIPHLYRGRNKTFFFFAYEGFRKNAAAQTLLLVPTPAQLGGDFSALLGKGVTIYNPFSTRPDPQHSGEYLRDPFPGNIIPKNMLSPAALLYATLIPAPTVTGMAGGNLYDETPTQNTYNNYSGRIDQSFGTRDRVYGRISYVNQPSYGSGGFPGAVSTGLLDAWNGVVNGSHVFSPTAILDVDFGRNLGSDLSTLVFPNAPAGFGAALIAAGFSGNFISDFSGIPGTIIPGFGIAGYVSDTGQAIQDIQFANNYQYGGNFTKILNRHDIKMGGSLTSVAYVAPIAGADENTGASQTSNLEKTSNTGDALASFLVGVPTSTVRRDKSQSAHGGWVDSAYLQDQITVRPNLTVNLGVRYDVTIWPTFDFNNNSNGYLGDLDLANGTYILSAAPPACSPTVGAPCIPGGTLPANVVVTNNGHALHRTDTGDWQPRIGIAYQPRGTTSIRAGYNRLYDEWSGVTQDTQDVGGSWPGVGLLNIPTLNSTLVTATIGNPLGLAPGASIQAGPTPFSTSAFFFNPSLKTPYSDQWNLGISQQFGMNTTLELNYVGSHSSRLDLGGLKNTAEYPAPGNAGAVTSRRQYPYITPTDYEDSTGNSNYNALQASVNQATSHGLRYLLAYTWSKSIDLACSGYLGIEGCQLQNPYDPQTERSVSSFDLTNSFSGNVVYELPFGRGRTFTPSNRLLSYTIGGWQLNGIVVLTSGTPYSVTASGDIANTGNTFVQANRIGNPSLQHRTPAEWFNTNAFVAPPAFTFGTAGRNSLRSDWYRNADLSVFRTFPVTQRSGLEFRLEAFNAFNNVVFSAPGSVVNTASKFGIITSTANTEREVQLAVKFRF